MIPPPVSDVRRTVLPNGLRVVTDTVPGGVSATVSVWAGVGGRDEDPRDAGASHFLEHLLFKGTEQRSATQIAFDVDGMGGDMNAYTTSEYTAYYVRVPSTEVDAATDLLLDVVSSPALREPEFEVERSVILEELAAADDDPDDLVGVRLQEGLFPGHPLGRDVLGRRDTIDDLTRDRVAAFFEHWYTPANLVVTAAGAVDHDALVQAVAARFGAAAAGSPPRRTVPSGDAPARRLGLCHQTDLVHLALGWRFDASLVEERFALAVVNQVLGSGPASRLFQEVREQRALSYSISSGVSHYADAGTWVVQCATTQGHAQEALDVIGATVRAIAEHGVSDGELERAKRSLRGGLLLALEDSGSRAARLGIAETTRGRYLPIAEHLERLDGVSGEDAARVAAQALGAEGTLSVVAPIDTDLELLRY